MDATTARTLNIRDLVAAAGGPTRFAEKYNGGRWSQAQVSQWISEDRPKSIGAKLARTIEQETGHPRGWMDTYQQGDASSRELAEIKSALIALVAGMASHRPAEGEDVAAALRASPLCKDGSLLSLLAARLERTEATRRGAPA